ncbi:unnamed protein product [Prorocentrum cordatum]|uniref:Uncharacterized protein n=1 Tax=Prorocentrum cordatum TaxID=2364126 RepID=A0ABN9P6W1_9DINO|nr:unnamed protein product [Polarella glacialis]
MPTGGQRARASGPANQRPVPAKATGTGGSAGDGQPVPDAEGFVKAGKGKKGRKGSRLAELERAIAHLEACSSLGGEGDAFAAERPAARRAKKDRAAADLARDKGPARQSVGRRPHAKALEAADAAVAAAEEAAQAAADRLAEAEERRTKAREKVADLEEEAAAAMIKQERLQVSQDGLQAVRGLFFQLRTFPTARQAGNIAGAWRSTTQQLQAVEGQFADRESSPATSARERWSDACPVDGGELDSDSDLDLAGGAAPAAERWQVERPPPASGPRSRVPRSAVRELVAEARDPGPVTTVPSGHAAAAAGEKLQSHQLVMGRVEGEEGEFLAFTTCSMYARCGAAGQRLGLEAGGHLGECAASGPSSAQGGEDERPARRQRTCASAASGGLDASAADGGLGAVMSPSSALHISSPQGQSAGSERGPALTGAATVGGVCMMMLLVAAISHTVWDRSVRQPKLLAQKAADEAAAARLASEAAELRARTEAELEEAARAEAERRAREEAEQRAREERPRHWRSRRCCRSASRRLRRPRRPRRARPAGEPGTTTTRTPTSWLAGRIDEEKSAARSRSGTGPARRRGRLLGGGSPGSRAGAGPAGAARAGARRSPATGEPGGPRPAPPTSGAARRPAGGARLKAASSRSSAGWRGAACSRRQKRARTLRSDSD